jgi:hypothetical protein
MDSQSLSGSVKGMNEHHRFTLLPLWFTLIIPGGFYGWTLLTYWLCYGSPTLWLATFPRRHKVKGPQFPKRIPGASSKSNMEGYWLDHLHRLNGIQTHQKGKGTMGMAGRRKR